MKIKIPKEIREKKIINSKEIYYVMQTILRRENIISRNKEYFWVLGLSNNEKMLNIELIAVGDENSVSIDDVFIFRIALLKGAKKMILVHNHVGANCEPSEKDRELTKSLLFSGNILNIPVIDHIIISNEDYFSFKEKGLLLSILEELSVDIMSDDFLEKEAVMGELKLLFKGKMFSVIMNLIKAGVDIKVVSKAVGMSKKEIRDLIE